MKKFTILDRIDDDNAVIEFFMGEPKLLFDGR
jgi:hypothetical protein